MENKKENPALYRWSPSKPRWSDRADFNRYSDDEDNTANAKEGDEWLDAWEAANRATWEGEGSYFDEVENPKQIAYFSGSEYDSSEFDSVSPIKEPSSRDSDKSAFVEEVESFRKAKKAKKDPSPPDSHEYASTEEEAFREAKNDPSLTESASIEEEKAFREAKEAPKSLGAVAKFERDDDHQSQINYKKKKDDDDDQKEGYDPSNL